MAETSTKTSKADDAAKANQDGGDDTNRTEDPNFDPNEEYEDEKKEAEEESKDGQGEGKDEEQADLSAHLPEEIVQSSETDQKSIYVKNVDYLSTKEDLTDFFKDCGKVNRVTIILDKFTGHPKGFAYIEFAEKESVENAKILDGATFKGRIISVMPKRTNQPHKGKATGRGRGRGRGGGSWGYRGNPGFYMRGPVMYPMMRGMRRGYRPY